MRYSETFTYGTRENKVLLCLLTAYFPMFLWTWEYGQTTVQGLPTLDTFIVAFAIGLVVYPISHYLVITQPNDTD